MLRVFGQLRETPAEVITELGETLHQNRISEALFGDRTRFTGPERSIGFRWFTDPEARRVYPAEDHPFISRLYASALREVVTLRGPGSHAAELSGLLLQRSVEFVRVWRRHEVGVRPLSRKRFRHPAVGLVELEVHVLVDPERSHRLLTFSALPGSESERRLRELERADLQGSNR